MTNFKYTMILRISWKVSYKYKLYPININTEDYLYENEGEMNDHHLAFTFKQSCYVAHSF